MNRLLQSLRENGLYVVSTHAVDYICGHVRNSLISRKLKVQKIKVGPRAYMRGLSSIEMGEDFTAGTGLWLEAITRYNDQKFSPKIIIGKRVRLSQFVHIAATHYVEIGDDVLIGSKVMITDHNHGQYSKRHTKPSVAPTLRPLDQDRRVVIGRNVWLGEGVMVTPGSYVGEGSVIGANSVVIGNIPAFSIAAGMPATVRKTFDFDTEEWSNVR